MCGVYREEFVVFFSIEIFALYRLAFRTNNRVLIESLSECIASSYLKEFMRTDFTVNMDYNSFSLVLEKLLLN